MIGIVSSPDRNLSAFVDTISRSMNTTSSQVTGEPSKSPTANGLDIVTNSNEGAGKP
jgi:hypothetical protein